MHFKYLTWIIVSFIVVSCTKEGGNIINNDTVNKLLENYNEQEIAAIKADHHHVEHIAFGGKKPSPENKRLYLATIGAPGAGKSTILENYMEKHHDATKACVYLDPDQRALKFMAATYWQSVTCTEVSKNDSYQDCARTAYEKWRNASNFITYNLLNKAYKEGFSIAHGTTSQSSYVVDAYKKLQKKGYKIVLLMCMSDAKNRASAVKQREEKQGFVQSTQVDFVEKEKAILSNMPNYFHYADVIHVYWVEKYNQGAIEVATFTKENGWVTHAGQQKWVQKIKAAYEDNKSAEMPSFDAMVTGRN